MNLTIRPRFLRLGVAGLSLDVGSAWPIRTGVGNSDAKVDFEDQCPNDLINSLLHHFYSDFRATGEEALGEPTL